MTEPDHHILHECNISINILLNTYVVSIAQLCTKVNNTKRPPLRKVEPAQTESVILIDYSVIISQIQAAFHESASQLQSVSVVLDHRLVQLQPSHNQLHLHQILRSYEWLPAVPWT